MNRRDFLQPRQLAETAAQMLGRDGSSCRPADNPVLLRFARGAMATTFEIILPFATPAGSQAAAQALDLIDALEDQLTVFRDHSEVSRLNARAADEPVRVSGDLFDLLFLAKRLHEETDRALDISVGALTKAWGFFRREGRVPAPDECAAALEKAGMQHVELDVAHRTVFYRRPGLEINLGSIGKGHALDQVVQLLWRDWNIGSALVHGGNSSIVALGSEPGSDNGWPISLADPRDPARQLGVFRLRNRALGTSAATYQSLVHEGRRLGHILDPRSGWPAEGILSATATAPTAAVADGLATAFFILGVEPVREYCRTHPEVGAVLVPQSPNPRPIRLGRAKGEFVPG